ncbi:MAG TPA: hypothetical protein VNG13_08275 [Mycobacteriales bacterium]|nr:hypothetical protein [Mycobacteriales bacterium]
MYWCYYCYSTNEHPSGPCRTCGRPVEGPGRLTPEQQLIWALHHPDGDRAVLAARAIAARRVETAIPVLRALVEGGTPDIYVAKEALCALITLEGPRRLRDLLDQLAANGPLLLREIAKEARVELPTLPGARPGPATAAQQPLTTKTGVRTTPGIRVTRARVDGDMPETPARRPVTPKTLAAVGLWGATTTVVAYLLSFGSMPAFVVLLVVFGVLVRLVAVRIARQRGSQPPKWWSI